MKMQTVSKIAVVVAMVLGIGMVVIGGFFITMGFNARADIREALVKENVITSKDAEVPGAPVHDARTARMQQDVIEQHTFGRWGPYSGMERTDPNRQTYLNGLTLRNSLNLAILGFGVADLAIGTGAISIVLGLIITGLAVPVHLLVMRQQQLTRV
jgi:hypothetical protein